MQYWAWRILWLYFIDTFTLQGKSQISSLILIRKLTSRQGVIFWHSKDQDNRSYVYITQDKSLSLLYMQG